MDDHTDDRDPDLPPVGTPEELEEALKWLEELTARQAKPADKSSPAPAASLDSPFRGLIDSDDGDLPDWLREVPSSQQLDRNEPESRLDWLAKMAQQESIEELPTLEWRRLSEPTQSAILGGQDIDMPTEAYPGPSHHQEPEDASPEEIEADPAAVPEEITVDQTEEILSESVVESSAEIPEELPIDLPEETLAEAVLADVETVEEVVVAEVEQQDPTPYEPEVDTHHLDEELSVTPIAPVTMGLDEMLVEDRLSEDVAERLSAEPDDEDGPLDDLDAAMAWIEELAASQNAPVEDVPSVADRALASKLMMEAGLTPNVSPLDELGSDSDLVEGLTPTHPFIEEEDFADTVVLVETIAADQGVTLEPEARPEDAQELEAEGASLEQQEGTEEPEPPDIAADMDDALSFEEVPEELSFEEAMAFLDEIAVTQELDEVEAFEPASSEIEEELVAAVSVGEELLENETADLPEEPAADRIAGEEEVAEQNGEELEEPESLSAEDMPWLDTPAEPVVVVPSVEYVETSETAKVTFEGLNGTGYGELESTLLTLDALALPPGKTLDDVAAKLTAAQMTSWRDVDSALNWLEETLNNEPMPAIAPADGLDDASLIEQMPEDPDAVLAWLEQMAAQEDTQASDAGIPSEELSGIITDRAQSESLVEELAEADLLNMPDDPDEAMAWLEGLARGSQVTPLAAEELNETGSVQQVESVEADSVIEQETAAEPDILEYEGQLVEPEAIEEPEIEIFIDQEEVIIDTDIEEFTASSTAEQIEGEIATDDDRITEDEFLSVESDELGETIHETSTKDEIILDESLLDADDAEPIDWPEEQAEIGETDDVMVPISVATVTETMVLDELSEPEAAEEMSVVNDEEATAAEQPIEEPAPAPQTKPQTPSWLDLLKPLD